jgi:hypothetical protein
MHEVLRESTKLIFYKPGQKAPASGLYEIVDPHGQATGQIRPMDRGHTFPPAPQSSRYIIRQEIHPLYTNVASKAAIDETTRTFAVAIAHLAKL